MAIKTRTSTLNFVQRFLFKLAKLKFNPLKQGKARVDRQTYSLDLSIGECKDRGYTLLIALFH